MHGDTPPSLLNRRFIRVRNRRAGNMVEFDFAIGTPEIFVELIMPEPAFDQFCLDNHVIDLTGTTPAADAFDVRLSQAQTHSL